VETELERTQGRDGNEEDQIYSNIAKALPDSAESHSCRRIKKRGDRDTKMSWSQVCAEAGHVRE
jgi:hypothetical protein